MNPDILLLSVISAVLFLVAIIAYFRVAEHYLIIDRPNERSSHTVPTIRGGGIIFVFAMLVLAILNSAQPLYFLIGFFAIAIISFIDDVRSLDNRIRLAVHFVAINLLIFQVTTGDVPWWLWGGGLVVAIGVLNAYNFMDGINGITGLYTLVLLGTMLYLQQAAVLDLPIELILLPIIALVVFNFFNVRKKARCFAGDVGSVSLAFIVIFMVGTLSWQQQEWMYIWLLAIYGVDSVLTIAQRIYMRQNIFQAHRLHLYQLMANEGKISHLVVSASYAIAQLLINVLLIGYIFPNQLNPIYVTLSFAVIFLLTYIPLKYYFYQKK